jgi:hypothetical protein
MSRTDARRRTAGVKSVQIFFAAVALNDRDADFVCRDAGTVPGMITKG